MCSLSKGDVAIAPVPQERVGVQQDPHGLLLPCKDGKNLIGKRHGKLWRNPDLALGATWETLGRLCREGHQARYGFPRLGQDKLCPTWVCTSCIFMMMVLPSSHVGSDRDSGGRLNEGVHSVKIVHEIRISYQEDGTAPGSSVTIRATNHR